MQIDVFNVDSLFTNFASDVLGDVFNIFCIMKNLKGLMLSVSVHAILSVLWALR